MAHRDKQLQLSPHFDTQKRIKIVTLSQRVRRKAKPNPKHNGKARVYYKVKGKKSSLDFPQRKLGSVRNLLQGFKVMSRDEIQNEKAVRVSRICLTPVAYSKPSAFKSDSSDNLTKRRKISLKYREELNAVSATESDMLLPKMAHN